jgi:hypothetical protein
MWLARHHKGQEEFYEYRLVYTDNLLAIAMNPQAIPGDVDLYFNFKLESVLGHPNIHLGSKVSKARMANGVEWWCNSSHQNVKEAIKNTEAYIRKHPGKILWHKTLSPMETNYRPQLDVLPALGPVEANYYQSQIGPLRWAVELGHMDITMEVLMVASHNALPRQGHLHVIFRIFSYLKTKSNARLVLDPMYAPIDYDAFPKENCDEFYGGAVEHIPANAPPPLGKPVEVRCYVDADHVGNKLTRKLRTGIVIFQTSTFGSEFVALKIATEIYVDSATRSE